MAKATERMGPPAHPSVKLTLYVPGWLVSMAKAKGLNLSRVMTAALSRELGVAEDPTPRITALRAELEVLEAQLGLLMSVDGVLGQVMEAWTERMGSSKFVGTQPVWFQGWWEGRRLEWPALNRMTAGEVWALMVRQAAKEEGQ